MYHVDFEMPRFDPHAFNDEYELDYSTPEPPVFGSQAGSPVGFERPQRDERNPGTNDSVPFHYTITWKLQLRKGRITTLTEDTVEDIVVAPSTYWTQTLESERATVVKSKVPESQYQPEQTIIIISNSKRGVSPFRKDFPASKAIDWVAVEKKLSSWSNQGNDLTVTISFIYKEAQPDTTNKTSKTGRGATSRQLAARDKLVTQQEASGTRPVWRDVYDLLECSSAACANRGHSCWRDRTNNNKHYKLDSDIMERAVDYAEEGNDFKSHDDMPDGIRELIRQRAEEDIARKQRKRKASDSLPVTLNVYCHGHQNNDTNRLKAKTESPTRTAHPATLQFPMPKDVKEYTDWLCAQVISQIWQEAYRLACKITLDNGYNLEQLYVAQSANAKMLAANGVLQGIALQFVSSVKDWLDDISAI